MTEINEWIQTEDRIPPVLACAPGPQGKRDTNPSGSRGSHAGVLAANKIHANWTLSGAVICREGRQGVWGAGSVIFFNAHRYWVIIHVSYSSLL